MCRTFPDQGFCGYKAVTIQGVINDRPGWFDFGQTEKQRSQAKFSRSEDENDSCPTEVKAEEVE